VVWTAAFCDETSTGDKLRILYSNRFTFTSEGYPLVTVEIVSGQSEISISAKQGMLVQPDGAGGAEIAGGDHWTITVDKAKAARIRQWTVVDRLGPDDEAGVARSLGRWKDKGFSPRRFEVGTIFGVEGEVIDSREVLVAVAPVAAPGGGKRARQIARDHKISTSVHPEMIRRPRGTIVARSGDTVVRNPAVIWFRPLSDDGTISVKNVITGHGGSQGNIKRETRRYFGALYITLGSDGKLAAVNAVSADRLLAGLVPAEIFAESPEQALAAQAIAARTELLQKIGTRHLTDPYLLCSNQHCQVYSGAGREHPRTNRAVAKTRGKVLFRDGGGIVDARYSAACGGHSEHNDNIWGDAADPSLRGHLDGKGRVTKPFANGIDDGNVADFLALPGKAAYCGATRYSKNRYRWNKRVTQAELAKKIAAHYPGVGVIRKLEPLRRGVSGRINRLRVHGSKKSVVVSGDLHIRRLLGGLRSTLFTVRAEGKPSAPTAFTFTGAGFGHGVGMCQLGAIGMADQGHDHGAILHHYYPGSHLQRLY
jgi:stage II sporulation protein D